MKKITKDVRFVAAVFVSVFVILGGAAVYASTGSRSSAQGSGSAKAPYTSAFYFKDSVLRLGLDSKPNTSFLVITDQAAIVDCRVDGSAVEVQTNPFAVKALKTGQALVYLSALMRNGEVKTINCTVIVQGETATDVNDGNPDEQGGTKDGGTDQFEDRETVNAFLSYSFENAQVVVFSLTINGNNESAFKLSAEVIEGDVSVGIMGVEARIKYKSEHTSFKIRFTAAVNDVIVAAADVQNCL